MRGLKIGRLLCFLLLPLSLPLAFLNAGYFFAAPAEQPRTADAMVLLGGDSGPRGIRGLELFKEGYADNVILVRLEFGNDDFGKRYSHGQVKEFLAAGARKENIFFDTRSWHSWDEAVNTLALMKEKNWKRVLVVSDPPHMRRLQWIWGKVFRGTGLDYTLVASNPHWWHPESWWKNGRSFRFVVNECEKLIYYRISY